MDVINIIFRLFDFCVVIGLAYYGIYTYLIPEVEKLMREYGVFIYNLESDCKNVRLQTQSILENIQDQDRQFQAIQKKFSTWQKKCDELVLLRKAEQEKIDAVMERRHEKRLSYIQHDQILQEKLPVILNSVTKDLQIRFSDTNAQEKYMDELIQIMKERS